MPQNSLTYRPRDHRNAPCASPWRAEWASPRLCPNWCAAHRALPDAAQTAVSIRSPRQAPRSKAPPSVASPGGPDKSPNSPPAWK